MTDSPVQTIEDLETAVEEALRSYGPVRDSIYDVQTQVSADGSVEVSGHVRSGLIKDGVVETLRWVPGVTGVVDELVADSELEIDVAIALAMEPRLKDLPPGTIAVHAHLGHVTLVGDIENESLREAAVEAASQVMGVQEVKNLMTPA